MKLVEVILSRLGTAWCPGTAVGGGTEEIIKRYSGILGRPGSGDGAQ
jgi:hypothetical protein